MASSLETPNWSTCSTLKDYRVFSPEPDIHISPQSSGVSEKQGPRDRHGVWLWRKYVFQTLEGRSTHKFTALMRQHPQGLWKPKAPARQPHGVQKGYVVLPLVEMLLTSDGVWEKNSWAFVCLMWLLVNWLRPKSTIPGLSEQHKGDSMRKEEGEGKGGISKLEGQGWEGWEGGTRRSREEYVHSTLYKILR